MQQVTKLRFLQLVARLLLAVGFVAKQIYRVLVGWWLHPLLDKKWNRELVKAIQANLPSLLTPQSSMRVVRADWPTVEVTYENLLFTIVEWRDEIIVRVAPHQAPTESYEIGRLVAAIEHRHYSERDVVNDLCDVERLLAPRLPALNAHFQSRNTLKSDSGFNGH